MTTLDDSPRTDLSLVADVRDGWRDAFGELYRRHHGPALRYALMLTGGNEAQAQDLVAEAFARVLRATSDGGGSTVAFRPYLLSAVRHEYLAELRRSGRIDLVESADELDSMSRNGADDERIEDPTLTSAFKRLPARWRTVLLRTEVFGDKPADVASEMGISANAAAALASRAREGLKQEYLQEHVARTRAECGPYASRLARLVRDALSPREQQLVEAHLRLCDDCSRARSELRGLNGRIRTIFPVIVGAGAVWPGQGLQSLSGLPAAAGGSSSWVGSACVAGAGAVAAPAATVATTTAGIGVAGVVTAGFAKVAATAAAVVAGSAAAFGFAANPAPVGDQADDPHVVVTSATESPTSDAATSADPANSAPSEQGLLADDATPTEAVPATTGDVTSSLMAPEQSAGEDGNPLGEAGGPPSASVSTGESPSATTPAGERAGKPSSGSGEPSSGSGGDSSAGSGPGSRPESGVSADPSAPPQDPPKPDHAGSGNETAGNKGDGNAQAGNNGDSNGQAGNGRTSSGRAGNGQEPESRARESSGPPPWAPAARNATASSEPEWPDSDSDDATDDAAAARALVREWRQAWNSATAPKWPGFRWFGNR